MVSRGTPELFEKQLGALLPMQTETSRSIRYVSSQLEKPLDHQCGMFIVLL